ncbi:MAG: penicillin-binding protein 2 [Candidatus Andersenbacteria bacterium]
MGVSLIENINRQPTKRVSAPRFHILYLALFIATAILVSRSFYLQVLQGSRFLADAEGNRVASIPVIAPRGIIYDRTGKQLVENVASTDLVLDPTILPSEEFEAPLIEKLPQYITLTPEQIQKVLQTTRHTQRVTVLAKALDHDTVLRLQEAQSELPGIRLISSLVRKYPYEQAAAHILGYTSPITAEELEKNQNFLSTDITGKTGLEKQYDQELHGKHGALYVEVDATGRPQKELKQELPVEGNALHLTIDIELQEYIHQLLNDYNEQSKQDNKPLISGAVVALDPRSGSIRALVSFPSYDPNVFSQPALKDSATALFKAPLQPLFNRVSDGAYPPGSTIKPLLAAAALEEGVITPQTTVLSTGGLAIGPWNFPDWKAGGHGTTEVTKAIAESVNTFFYLLAGGDETRSGLGVSRITAYLEKFGWGKATGIDLPSETSGFLPTPAWKEAVKKERWYIGDTYHLGIGQGDVLASPLQITLAMAALANGGQWHEPYLVESLTHTDTTQTPSHTSYTLPVQSQNIAVIRGGMRRTVAEGSGRRLAALPLALAGKTGTAQLGGTDDTHAWFTSFGPYESPELVLTVLLEKGGAGDRDAIPVAENIWQWWIEHRWQQ